MTAEMTELNYSTRFSKQRTRFSHMTSNEVFENCQLEESHTDKSTTWWPQNISFWPKINIPSSYFTILMLNCLVNTLKLQFDSYVTAVKFLT